jgi:bifunctional UDP-N-acetylglucosamine pyrophosphorylase/glucosamine-1-phosphate N-acetyltransferase
VASGSAPIRSTTSGRTEGVNDRIQLARLGAELNRRTLRAHHARRRDGRGSCDDVGRRDRHRRYRHGDQAAYPDPRGEHDRRRLCHRDRTRPSRTSRSGDGATVGADAGAPRGDRARRQRRPVLVPATPAPSWEPTGKIGGFVETKNAQIAPGAKVPHLTYAGDVTIGEKANIGAGRSSRTTTE